MTSLLSTIYEVLTGSSSKKRPAEDENDNLLESTTTSDTLNAVVRDEQKVPYSPLADAASSQQRSMKRPRTSTTTTSFEERVGSSVATTALTKVPRQRPFLSSTTTTAAAAEEDDGVDNLNAALAVPNPSVSGKQHALSAYRMRSLSRLFPGLPTDQPLPSYTQMIVDQMEYLMHVILLETHPHRGTVHVTNLKKVYETSFQSLPHSSQYTKCGRFYSRSMLTSLASDILLLQVHGDPIDDDEQQDEKEEEHSDDHQPNVGAGGVVHPAIDLSHEHWNTIQEHLMELKQTMIRQDANHPPPMNNNNSNQNDENEDDDDNVIVVDEQLAKHSMMTDDYEEVIRLLSVQMELTRLKEQLQEISVAISDTTTATMSSRKTEKGYPNTKSINQAVQKAVNQFMKQLSKIYPPEEDHLPPPSYHPTSNNEDVNDVRRTMEEEDGKIDDDPTTTTTMEEPPLIENDSTTAECAAPAEDVDDDEAAAKDGTGATSSTLRHKRRYSMSNIPMELHSFALTELYSPKQHPQRAPAMVDRLLKDILCITTDNHSTNNNNQNKQQPGMFSHYYLKTKIRSLLTKWSESILEIPTLVRLGYGGVPSPIVEKDEDDVSSWGGSDIDEKEKRTGTTAATNFSRHRSGSRGNLHHHHHGSSKRSRHHHAAATIVVTTDEDRDIIARLAEGGGGNDDDPVAAFTRSRSNSSDGLVHHMELVGKQQRHRKGKRSSQKVAAAAALTAIAASETDVGVSNTVLDDVVGDPNNNNNNNNTDDPERPIRSTVRQITEGGDGRACRHEGGMTAYAMESTDDKNMSDSDNDDADVNVNNRHDKAGRVKAGRRLLEAISKKRRLESESVTAVSPTVRERRTTEGGISDEDSEDEIRQPVKLSRASKWATRSSNTLSGALRELVTRETTTTSKENSPPSRHATPRGRSSHRDGTATRLEWSGSEYEDEDTAAVATKPVQRRRPFTEEEADAVRDGVARYGLGNWTTIQSNDPRLKYRNPMQIKDKYRTMRKNDEI